MLRKIDRLKQAALEKIGVAESTDVPKIKEAHKKVKADESLFRELVKNLEKQLTHLSGFIESGEDFKNNIGSWEKTVMDRGENFKLVEGLKRCGDWQNSVNQQFSKLHQHLSERVLELTKNFVKVDVAEARSHKKKWVKLRQAYDASETKIAAKGEDAKLKEEHAEIMKLYLKSEVDTSAILTKTLKGSEKLLIDIVGQYWDIYSVVFVQGCQLIERINTSLESLQLCPSFGALSRTISMPNMAGNKTNNNNNNNKNANPARPPRNPRVPNTKIFGIYLEDLWDKNSKSFPSNLVQVIEHLEEHGPNEEELFKMPGNAKNIDLIKKGLDEGTALNSCGVLGDSLSIATVFKEFLLQLPEPLIPFSFLSQFVAISNKENSSAKQEDIRRLCSSLPEPHSVFLRMILRTLGTISRESVQSKKPDQVQRYINDMAIELSIVIGPAAMRSTEHDDAVVTAAINLFKFLILNVEAIFKEVAPPRNLRPMRAQSQPSTISKNAADNMKSEMNQLLLEVIENLETVKMRTSATISFEECAPFVLKIKNVLQNTLQIKPLVVSEVAKVDKSALQATEDKLAKAQNAVQIFAVEIQAILQAIQKDINSSKLSCKDPHWKTICDNLQKTQTILLQK